MERIRTLSVIDPTLGSLSWAGNEAEVNAEVRFSFNSAMHKLELGVCMYVCT